MNIDFSQILIQIIAFIIMLGVLKKFGWQPILDLLHARQQKIQSEFDSIANEHDQVQKLTQEYKDKLKEIDAEARRKIQEAVNQGNEIAQQIKHDTQAEAKEILLKTKQDVENEIDKAKHQLKNDIVNIAVNAAQIILEEKIDKAKDTELISNFVKEAELK